MFPRDILKFNYERILERWKYKNKVRKAFQPFLIVGIYRFCILQNWQSFIALLETFNPINNHGFMFMDLNKYDNKMKSNED